MGKDLRNKELGLGLSQRKDGLYMARFTNKKGKRIAITGHSLNDVRRRFEKAKIDDYENRSAARTRYTMKQWYDFWITNIKKPYGITQQYIDHLDAAFNTHVILKERGDIDIREIRMIDVQLMVNEAMEKSRTSARVLLSIMKQMFEIAYENDLIDKNPAKTIHIKRLPRKETGSMSRKDEEMLLINISSQKIKDMVEFLLNTGLRISELLGLSFDEIDMENKYIEISHQLSYKRNESGEFTFVETKNKKRRIIPLNSRAYEILERNIKKRQKEIGLDYRGKTAISDLLVFISINGDAYSRTGFNSALRYSIRKVKNSGYEFDCPRLSPHIFRHTFATRCLEAGMSSTTVSSLLGHGSIRMTLSYVHNSTEQFDSDIKLLNKL